MQSTSCLLRLASHSRLYRSISLKKALPLPFSGDFLEHLPLSSFFPTCQNSTFRVEGSVVAVIKGRIEQNQLLLSATPYRSLIKTYREFIHAALVSSAVKVLWYVFFGFCLSKRRELWLVQHFDKLNNNSFQNFLIFGGSSVNLENVKYNTGKWSCRGCKSLVQTERFLKCQRPETAHMVI